MSTGNTSTAAPVTGADQGEQSELVRSVTADERTFAALQLRIAARRERSRALETEHEALREALGAFATHVLDRIDNLVQEVRQLRQLVRDTERRANGDDPDDHALPPVDEDLRDHAADVGVGVEHDPDERHPSARQNTRRSPDLRQLYRDLARRHHPDLALDAADRARRDAIMRQINAAYAAGDLTTLQRLHRHLGDDLPVETDITLRITWALAEIDRLDRLLVIQEAELTELRRGRAYRLWNQSQAGEPVVAEIEAELRRERIQLTRRLRRLRRAAANAARSAGSSR